jgi:hypothetical protein
MKINATLSDNKKLSGAATNEQTISGSVNAGLEVSGNLSAVESITVEVVTRAALNGSATSQGSLAGNLAAAYESQIPPYEGDYEVTPKVEGQELKTKHKYMIQDVTVHAIPFFEVSNTSGGNTVYIANEIEFE